ncbi:uncharacterized protein LOC102806380 [Saccoglossus kowalevskii]
MARQKKNSADSRRPRRRRFHAITEYNTMYKSYPLSKNESFKPTGCLTTEGGIMNGTTTHRDDFKTYKIDKPTPIYRNDQIETNIGDMDLRTSYDSEYSVKQIDPNRFVRQNERKPLVSPAKFSGDPTYKADYRKWEVGRREVFKAPDEYKPSKDPLENTTTFRRDFQAKKTTPVKSMKPEQKVDQSDEPIDTNTSHRLDYVVHPIPPKHVREKPQYTRNTVQMDAMTTSKHDYTEKKANKMGSCRPSQEPMKSEDPFIDATTNKSDYQKWHVTLPKLHQAEVYQQPVGEMDTLTTSKRDFPPRRVDRVVAKKPSSDNKMMVGAFYDQTNYKEDFRNWEGHSREIGVDPSRKPYEQPTELFGGETNYQTNYKKKQAKPRHNFAPKQTLKEEEEFHGETSYNEEYSQKKLKSSDRSKKKLRPDHQIMQSSSTLPKIESMTTSKRDYTSKQITKQSSFKPSHEPLHSGEPFDGQTTNKSDYTQHVVRLPKLHEAEVYSKPEGTMEMETTFSRDFPPRKLEKIVMAKPPTRAKTDVGVFDSTTNYSNDFQKYESHQPVKATNPSRKPYTEPEEPFAKSSSYQREYDRKPISVRKAIVPKANELTNTNDTFDTNTLYKNEFIHRKSQKRTSMKPLGYGGFVMEYGENEVESSILPDTPNATTPPVPAQVVVA